MAKRVYEFYPKKELVIGNKYILKEYISEGTFGYVWSAIHLDSEELVALKIPKDQERGDHALSEGIKLIGYSHPNIIKINWMGRLDGVFVIEMELFIKEPNPLTISTPPTRPRKQKEEVFKKRKLLNDLAT